MSPNLNVRIGRRIDVRLSHTFQRLSHEGEEIFQANLSQARAVYNFNPRSFVRVIVQYRDTNRNPEQFENSEVDRSRTALFTQVELLEWPALRRFPEGRVASLGVRYWDGQSRSRAQTSNSDDV